MCYGDLSNTDMIISYEVELGGIYEAEMWYKFHIWRLVIG